MSTGITGRAAALISTALALAATLICAPVSSADPGQDQQFLNLLEEQQIPAMDDIPALINRAHAICTELDQGTPYQTIVGEEMDVAFAADPILHRVPDRLERTAHKFITASVVAYCPNHRAQLP